MKKINATRSDVVKDMEKVFEEEGKLTYNSYCEKGKYSNTVFRRFGKFNELKKEAIGSLQLNQYNISKEDLIDDILLVAEKNPNMTRDIYIEKGRYSRKPIDRHFGSWNKMLQELDLKINCLINIPEETLLEDLQRLMIEFDSISSRVVKHHGRFSTEVYQRRFGSFNAALTKAGIEPNMRGGASPMANSMIKICESILGEEPEKEKTFDWLFNPETNRALYLDAFFENHNLAFEYDGPQHFESFTDLPYSQGIRSLEQVQYLDSLKNRLLNENGIKLVRLSCHEPHSREYLARKISQIL